MVEFSPDIKVLFHFPGFAPVFYQQACELHIATHIFQIKCVMMLVLMKNLELP